MSRVVGPSGWCTRVGPYLREIREESGLRLQDLAERVGAPLSYLSAVERGDIGSPAPDRLVKIAVALGEDPDEALVRAGYLPEALWRLATLNPQALTVALRTIAANTDRLSTFDGEFDVVIADPPYAPAPAAVSPRRTEDVAVAALVAKEMLPQQIAPSPARRSSGSPRRRTRSRRSS